MYVYLDDKILDDFTTTQVYRGVDHDLLHGASCSFLSTVTHQVVTYRGTYARLNGDVAGILVASSNDALEGVLQLGEV